MRKHISLFTLKNPTNADNIDKSFKGELPKMEINIMQKMLSRHNVGLALADR